MNLLIEILYFIEVLVIYFKLLPKRNECNKRDKRVLVNHITSKIYDLRFSLVGQKIDLDKAKELLFLPSNHLKNEEVNKLELSSKCIYYIYDSTKDQTSQVAEYIVFQHKFRDQLAYYKLMAFNLENYMGYTVSSQNDFWSKNDFSELLATNYKRLVSCRRIQSHLHDNWISKPLCKDGKPGILCKIGWDYIKNL